MPWNTKADVARHNKNAANDPALRKKKVANSHLADHPNDEAGAIKIANGVIRKRLREQREASNIIPDSEILSEFNFRSLGHNIVNRTLAKMGSGAAQGRLDRQETLDKLMNMYNQFLAHQRAKPTLATLFTFLRTNYGDELAVYIANQITNGTNNLPQETPPPIAGNAPTDADGGAAPAAAAGTSASANSQSQFFKNPNLNAKANDILNQKKSVNADTSFYANKAKQAGTKSSATGYQQDSFKILNSLVSSPQQDTRQIINLTKEILAHANDHGGSDKGRVMAYLKNLRKNPRVLANPKLAQMFSGLRLESIRRTIDMAMFLVENEIKTKKGLNEAVSRFFLIEKPVGRAPDDGTNTPGAAGLRARYNASKNPPPPAPPQSRYPAPPPKPGAEALRARYNAKYGTSAAGGNGGGAVPPATSVSAAGSAGSGGGTPPNAAPNAAAGPTPSNPNQLLSRKQLVQYFGTVASILLRAGVVNFSSKNKSSGGGGETYYRKTKTGRYKPAAEPSLATAGSAAAPPSSNSSYDRLNSAFSKKGLDRDPAVQKYLQLLRQGRNSGQLFTDALKNLPPKALEVLHSVAGS